MMGGDHPIMSPTDHPLIHLERRLKERYHLRETEIDLAGRRFSLLSVASIDELLDQVIDEDDIPFWAEIWPASLGCLDYLGMNPDMVRGRRVLELGCGMGIVGLGVILNGGDLVQSDYVTEALQFAAVNAARNGLNPARTLLADWRRFTSDEVFDLIVGSDILYEKKLHPYLYPILAKSLAPGGRALLADPGREYAKLFMANLPENCWSWRKEVISVPVGDRDQLIDIYILQKLS